MSNCLIRCVCKKSFLSFSYFSMVIKKNMQNQNKFVGNSQALPPPPSFQLNFRHCICVAIFIILESQSEKLWHQTTSYAHKTTTSYAHKTTSLTAETNKFQLTNMLFNIHNFLKRCFER